MIAVRLGAVTAIAIALYGQPKPEDVPGWDKIEWGMTIAEVRSAYHVDTAPESNDSWTLLNLNPVKLGTIQMGVQVGARRASDKIVLVRLSLFFGLPSSAPSAGPQDFDTLKATLTKQYGPPDKEETTRGENSHLIRTVLWTFPSTSILLTLEQSASLPNLGNIYLDYTANGK